MSAAGPGGLSNRSVKDDIRDYWSIRAETYDLSPGHGQMDMREAQAWRDLIRDHLGHGEGRRALDLGCGTGTMSLLMQAAGFDVTGLDFAGPMLERARRKAKEAGVPVTFVAGDAEHTLEPEAQYDAIIARNLLWTLPDPRQAVGEWCRILRPGGRLLVIDGDFVRQSRIERLMPLLDGIFGKIRDGHSLLTVAQWEEHGRIMARLPFHRGMRVEDVMALFAGAGLMEQRRDGLQGIRRGRGLHLASRAGVIAWSQHRFAVSACKPQEGHIRERVSDGIRAATDPWSRPRRENARS